jgi:hypothetical protein
LLRDVGGGHLVACHLVGPGRAAPRLIDVPADVREAREAREA